MSPATQSPPAANPADIRAMLRTLDDPELRDPRLRQQAAAVAFGRRTAAQPPVSVLMQDAVALLGEVLESDLSGAGELAENGKSVRIEIAAADEDGHPAESRSTVLSLDPDRSIVAFALAEGQPVTAEDLAAEDRFDDRTLRRLGVKSALVVPLHQGDRPLGALAVYYRRRRHFLPGDVRFAETIAHLLTSAMARLKAEEELSKVRQIAESATRELALLRQRLAGGKPNAAGETDGRAAGGATPAADATGDSGRPFQTLGGGEQPNQRRSTRRAFRYRQLIAPMQDGCLPSRNNFVEVECRDISAGGIAFVLPNPPDFEDLVVALGKPPDESHFTAKVVRIQEWEDHGRTRHVVGCRFTGRVYM